MVGVGGFEPPASRSRTVRSPKLSHTPTGRLQAATASIAYTPVGGESPRVAGGDAADRPRARH